MGPLEIVIGKHYEVQPENFQRVFIGEAREVNDRGILFGSLSIRTDELCKIKSGSE